MKKIGNNQTETWLIGLVPVFIGLLMLVLSIPMDSLAVPPGNVDSGNYVADNHDTHVAYYNFNDIYTDEEEKQYIWDDSGRDKKGFLEDNAEGTDEKDDNINGYGALSFDGDGDYIHVDTSGDFNISGRNFVISALIWTDSSDSELTICSRGDYGNSGFKFCIESGLLTFRAWNMGSYFIYDIGGNDLRDENWHYVAVEYYQGTARLYIDPSPGSYGEVESKSFTSLNYPGNCSYPFFIGKGQSASDYFEGIIDFVYFYAIEIPSFPAPSSRDRMWGMENVGYWPMDEGLIGDVPEDRNIINDMARSDFHSYGIAGESTGFGGSNTIGNGAPGTHYLQFGGGPSGVMVDDENDYLDFACDPGEDDIYIEFWVNIEDTEGNMLLIEKWDWLEEEEGSANGYRIYVDYDGLTETYAFAFELACDSITTLSLSGCDPGYWYHLWAWSDASTGTMNMSYDAHLHFSASSSTSNTYGIGETDNDLFFATGRPYWITPQQVDWVLVGKMDDVVIGRCYPY